jgi:putative membrane protein
MKNNTLAPKILLALYVVLFIICAINPYARDVWWAENLTVLAVVIPIVILYFCKVRFSATAYILMSIFIFMHTIGGHFTFERVPFGFIDNLIGSTRDNYDRIAHFTVGFYAYPAAELLIRRKWVTSKAVAVLFGLFMIMSIAAAYEIFEWQYAVHSDPAAGIAVLGSQGDIWDAQEDMLADTLGGVSILALTLAIRRKKAWEA